MPRDRWISVEKRGRKVAPALYQAVKRTLDILLAAVGLIVALPLVAVVGLIALLVQGRPVFYVSRRYVSTSRTVKIYKFRSMVLDAQSPKFRLTDRFMRDGYLDIPIECEVYTPLGRILERTQIVELPQILNVLVDGMSWVGNRALPEENVRLLGQFSGWDERFRSPCGLTGISQVVGKLNLTPHERITVECLYSRVYQHGNVLKCDVLIILATIRLIVFNRHVSYADAIALLNRCL